MYRKTIIILLFALPLLGFNCGGVGSFGGWGWSGGGGGGVGGNTGPAPPAPPPRVMLPPPGPPPEATEPVGIPEELLGPPTDIDYGDSPQESQSAPPPTEEPYEVPTSPPSPILVDPVSTP
jgi:hypothetical protein